LVELPKSQVLPVVPSFTELALKPAIDPVIQVSGSDEYTRCRRCALSEAAHNIDITNAREKRLIIDSSSCLAIRARRRVSFVVAHRSATH